MVMIGVAPLRKLTPRLDGLFFDLTQSIHQKKLYRVVELAKSSNGELMTHPDRSTGIGVSDER